MKSWRLCLSRLEFFQSPSSGQKRVKLALLAGWVVLSNSPIWDLKKIIINKEEKVSVNVITDPSSPSIGRYYSHWICTGLIAKKLVV